MKLIKDLGTRLINNKWIRFGLFLCPFCLNIIERRLSNGEINKSCGCKESKQVRNNYKHGETDTKVYYIWCTMKSRCTNANNGDYKNYGSRGILICPEWTDKLNGYINFRDWALSNGYEKGLSIDRINNDGNYEPANCHFVARRENNRNKRNNKLTLEIINEIRELHKIGKYTQKELSLNFHITNKYLYKIINNKIWKN